MRAHADGAVVVVRLKPRSGADSIEGVRNEALQVRVKAPPVDGRANDALMRLVAKHLGVAPSKVELLRGQRGRDKQLLVHGADAAQVERRLAVHE